MIVYPSTQATKSLIKSGTIKQIKKSNASKLDSALHEQKFLE